eukprot:6944039-Lingulodinium_polyedra.AAC.1
MPSSGAVGGPGQAVPVSSAGRAGSPPSGPGQAVPVSVAGRTGSPRSRYTRMTYAYMLPSTRAPVH